LHPHRLQEQLAFSCHLCSPCRKLLLNVANEIKDRCKVDGGKQAGITVTKAFTASSSGETGNSLNFEGRSASITFNGAPENCRQPRNEKRFGLCFPVGGNAVTATDCPFNREPYQSTKLADGTCTMTCDKCVLTSPLLSTRISFSPHSRSRQQPTCPIPVPLLPYFGSLGLNSSGIGWWEFHAGLMTLPASRLTIQKAAIAGRC
jgi:hypothetical protein